MPWSVAIFDSDMRYIAHSKTWLSEHGITTDPDRSLVGELHYEVFAPVPAEWREMFRRGLELGETTHRAQAEFPRADGGHEILRVQVVPWHDRGAIAGLIVYAENVSEHVATRRRFEEHDAMIRDLFEKSPIGLNLCRMDGLWVQSNPAFLDMIGYSREEADNGLTYWQLTPRSYDADEAVQLEQLRTTRRYGPYEKEFIQKSGRHIPVRLNGFLVERDGETYIWSIIEDLTAQRELENAVERERIKAIQTAKLATLGELAASIAHEINNPLQIIEAYAYMIGTMIEKGETADATAGLRAIREATARAASIVSGLKRYARKSALEPERFDLARLVDDTVALWRLRVRSESVDLQVSLTSVSVVGRPLEISQVVLNLLNNAFDAIKSAKESKVRVSVESSADRAWVAVENSGPRIPDAIAEEIFRAFFTTKPSGEGTGLGLSISREIVERYGGTLTLDRSTAMTRFVIELPKAAV